MKDRIIEIMNSLELKPTTFANATGIKLATLSQILNGRNNPSLEVVMKIHSAFKQLNLEWILYGTGSMFNENDELLPLDFELSGNDENPKFTDEVTNDSENRKEIASKSPLFEANHSEPEVVKYVEKPVKKIKEIKIFFDDDTYETFVPQK